MNTQFITFIAIYIMLFVVMVYFILNYDVPWEYKKRNRKDKNKKDK